MDYDDEDPFDVVMFGYHRDQVDDFLRVQTEQEQARLAQSLRFADLERRLDDSQAENTKLRCTIDRLTEDLTMNRATVGASKRIQEMLRLAEEEAAAIRAAAATYADQIRRQAREDANLAAAQRRQGEALNLAKPDRLTRPAGKPEAKAVNGSKRGKAQVQT